MSDLFDFRARPTRYAVLGNPVKHSKSPQIHEAFARQFDIAMEYDRIQVDIGGFDQAVSHFGAHGGAGLNITVPFKVEAWQLCQRGNNTLSSRAAAAEAVNTLRFDEAGHIEGDNTDGHGLVRDIEHNIGFSLAGKDLLVIGAGGAVRGVLGPLTEKNPDRILVANRTPGKARDLARAFGDPVSGCGLEDIAGQFDLVINGSAASLDGEVPPVPESCLRAGPLAYDMMYGDRPTVFMNWALANGAARASDGLGMLVEQAAESFRLWHDCTPDTAPVIEALRKR